MEDCSATENSLLLTGRPTANVFQLENFTPVLLVKTTLHATCYAVTNLKF